MNILKILGIVVAIHVVAFAMIFLIPGCSSMATKPAPVASETAPPTAPAIVPATGSAPNPIEAATEAPEAVAPESSTPASQVSPSTPTLYSPTRPGSPAAEALTSPPPPKVTPATTYQVVAGDNLWNIARKHGTTVAEIVKVNHLTNASRLMVGQRLIIPRESPAAKGAGPQPAGSTHGATYVVKPGDTLSGIALQVGTTTAAIMRANHLKSEYLQVGQELRLPTELVTGAKTSSATHAASEGKAAGSVVHVVKPGETLGGIAREYHVKVSALAVANNIANPKLIKAGQRLVIPGAKATPPAEKPGKTPANAPVPTIKAPEATPPPEVTPAPAAATEPAPTPATSQDLDTGLKESASSVPVIKIEGAGTSKSQ